MNRPWMTIVKKNRQPTSTPICTIYIRVEQAQICDEVLFVVNGDKAGFNSV
jgi:hypothetical protein